MTEGQIYNETREEVINLLGPDIIISQETLSKLVAYAADLKLEILHKNKSIDELHKIVTSQEDKVKQAELAFCLKVINKVIDDSIMLYPEDIIAGIENEFEVSSDY